MNKKTKVWLITSAVLILSGLIIFGGAMMALKWDFFKLSTEKYETNEHTVSESFKNISVDTDTADIKFEVSKNTQCSVVCVEQANLKHSVNVSDGTLVIKLTDTRKWYEYVGINFGTPKITVYLQEGQYGELSVDSSTGDIELPATLSFDKINIDLSTGGVECRASAAENIKIKTSTGDVKVEDISAASLELITTTGKITASGIACTAQVNVNVTTGKTQLTNITCKSLTSTGNTGKISLTNVYVEDTMSVDRTTGDVILANSDAGAISIKTSTGDVQGTLHSPKTFYTSTSTGKVSVPKTSGEICEITTTTGDIEIEIATY